MKKIIAVLLCLVVSASLLTACGKKEGDLGEATTLVTAPGQTEEHVLAHEVVSFEFKKEEDELEKKETLRKDGFKVTKENTEYTSKLTKGDVLNIAYEEVTVEYNAVKRYHDKTRGIWKVEFLNMTETTEGNKINRTYDLQEAIYIDEEGYTLYAYTE